MPIYDEGPWGFVHAAYDGLLNNPDPSLRPLRQKVDNAYLAFIQGGNLETLYWTMKGEGFDFGEDDKHLRPLPTDAGALEYEDILAGEEAWNDTRGSQ